LSVGGGDDLRGNLLCAKPRVHKNKAMKSPQGGGKLVAEEYLIGRPSQSARKSGRVWGEGRYRKMAGGGDPYTELVMCPIKGTSLREGGGFGSRSGVCSFPELVGVGDLRVRGLQPLQGAHSWEKSVVRG